MLPQVISPASGAASGELLVAESLAGVQLVHYQQPTVLLALSVGGEEDVPHVS